MTTEDKKLPSQEGFRNIIALLSGATIAAGLSISGMTDPQKIIGFLDLQGNWNPQLLFVLVGALLVHVPANLYFKKMSRPLLDSKKHLPLGKDLNKDLILGSLLFGMGWALSGYCPGSGLVSVMDGNWPAITFVIAMTVGMAIHHFYKQLFSEEIF